MRKEILILRNEPRENPGLIELVLKEYNLIYRLIDFKSDTQFGTLEQYGAVIVLGGPESASDQTTKMLNELAFNKRVAEAEIPYLGICLGLQILVKALGGSIHKCEIPETGFRGPDGGLFRITLTEEGKSDRLLSHLPETFNVFQLHGETVRLTPEMTLLATGDYCPDQIIRTGKYSYGVQFHFELTDGLLHTWMEEDPDLRGLDSEVLLRDYNFLKTVYNNTGRQIIKNFLVISGLIPDKN